MIPPAHDALTAVFRQETPAVLATLARLSGDLDQAEDALQEALAVATEKWSVEGVPVNPGGWIMTTARRRLIDSHRRTSTGRTKEHVAGTGMPTDPDESDDRLMLLFTCCHPALSLESRVALTLRTISGLSTAEIAHTFLVPTTTMAQRLVRAKQKIRIANITYEIPDPDQWDKRLASVLATVYLTFTRGYDLGAERRGVDLATTGLELGRLLDFLIPDEPEIEGLLGLMLMTQARHRARLHHDGTVVLLENQDRSLWDQPMIDEGRALVARAVTHGSVGQYWLQAAIAAEHLGPSDLDDRDWSAIVALYDRLVQQTAGSPVVRLNRALARAEVADEATALEEIESLAPALSQYVPFHAARAHLLHRLGNDLGAANAYRHAIKLAEPGPQRNALARSLNDITESR